VTQKNERSRTDNERGAFIHPLRRLAMILLPSSLLLPVLILYLNAGGTSHFFLHTLMGWNIGLVLLSIAMSFGRSWSRWDGFLPLGVSFYALTPDFIYRFGPFHRDWMDLFLFHVSLDETLAPALPVLAILWVMLLVGYICLTSSRSPFVGEDALIHTRTSSPNHGHQFSLLQLVSSIILIALAISGLTTERVTHTSLVFTGQRAANFELPSTGGNRESLAHGRVVLLGFVPSVLCNFCQEQLRTLQELLPELQTHDIDIFVVSTDTSTVQQAVVRRLGLGYLLLSEAPSMNQHPAGSAYGVYHLAQQDAAPVDSNALVVIDDKGIIRALRIFPARSVTTTEIRALISTALGPIGDELLPCLHRCS